MDALKFIRVLLKRIWLIGAVVLISMLATFVISFNAEPQYRAEVQLATGLIGDNEGQRDQQMSPAFLFEVEARFNNLIAILRSDPVLQKVSYQLLLHDLRDPQPFRSPAKLGELLDRGRQQVAVEALELLVDTTSIAIENSIAEPLLADLAKAFNYDLSSLRSSLEVNHLAGTEYIELAFSSENPALSAFAANASAKAFIDHWADIKSAEAESQVSFYSGLVEKRQRELEQVLSEASGSLPVNANESQLSRSGIRKIARLEEKREELRFRFRAIDRTLRVIDRQLSTEDKEMVQTALSEANAKRSGLALMALNRQMILSRENSTRQADSLNLLLRQVSGQALEELPPSAATSNMTRQSLIEQKIENELDMMLVRNGLELIEQEVRRTAGSFGSMIEGDASPQVLQARDNYLSAVARLNEARLASIEANTQISQVASVDAPITPEPRNYWQLTAMAGLISLVTVAMVFFVLEYLDRSIRYPSEFTTITGLPLLGYLNRLPRGNLDLVALFQEKSSDKRQETFKQLLRKIRFEVFSENPGVILVTSLRDGEGKTSVMVSLGYSMCLNQRKVLLIDTNFKKNTLTQITGAKPNLERFLKGEIGQRQLISASIFEGLDVIGCEGGNYSPSEAFREDEFHKLLAELREQYDHIFLEGPALNLSPDSRELTLFVDSAIAVIGASTTIRMPEQESIGFLQEMEDLQVGGILNKVEQDYLSL